MIESTVNAPESELGSHSALSSALTIGLMGMQAKLMSGIPSEEKAAKNRGL